MIREHVSLLLYTYTASLVCVPRRVGNRHCDGLITRLEKFYSVCVCVVPINLNNEAA
jgi:hypothetical protein